MSRLLITLAYCQKDHAQAKTLLNWMGELGGPYPSQSILLAADNLVPHADKMALHEAAKDMFGHAETMMVNVPQIQQGWPKGANRMFHQASKQVMECFRQPFLWLEPDCVPLKPDWITQLEDAYSGSPKRFMGNFVHNEKEGLPKVYLPGCSIYPNDAHALLGKRCEGDKAWDIACADLTVPRAINTNLIQDFFGQIDLPPTFIAEKGTAWPKNAVLLSFIRPDAVLFHRVKDSSLIDLLRKGGLSTPPNRPGFSPSIEHTERKLSKPLRGEWINDPKSSHPGFTPPHDA